MKNKFLLVISFLYVLFFMTSCLKDMDDEGIYATTDYIGKVVEKSSMQPVKDVLVQVTDGSHVHAVTKTDSYGAFHLENIDFNVVSEDYYLWIDGSSQGLPSLQVELRGLGYKKYDYKALILYDKNNVDLLPKISTDSVSNLMALSAVVHGNVSLDGGYEVTQRGIVYAIHQIPTLDDSVIDAGSSKGSFNCVLSNLKKNTTYYVRTYAVNSIGTVFGAQKTFTTLNGVAELTTQTATDVSATSATIGGTITFDGGDRITARGICYGKSENPTVSDDYTVDGEDTGTFSHQLQDLETGTTYFYRVYATNSCGTSYGQQKSFNTTSGLPLLITTTASHVSATSFKTGGNITDNGGFNVTERGCCWNTIGNPDINDDHVASGSGNGAYSCTVTNLQADVTYHVRAYAINSVGVSYGNEIMVTTLSGNIVLTTSAIGNITVSSAKSGGVITDNGGMDILERGVCWNTIGNPNKSDAHTTDGTGSGAYISNISGLNQGTRYYVRAYATNGRGTSYGEEISFTTMSGLPQVSIVTVSNITATSAVCSADVSSDGNFPITAKGFCWSASQYPTLNDSHCDNGSGGGVINKNVSGLNVGTTYYIRAYATNSVGTTYGQPVVFTTGDGLPIIETSRVERSGNDIISGGHIISDGGYPVTSRGVCYGIYPNPNLTATYSHTEDGSGIGYYASTLDASMQGVIYIRSYATNANGTAYGNQISIDYEYLSLPTFRFNGHTYRVAPSPNISGDYYTTSASWQTANQYCQDLEAYGFSDWRLPTKDELQMMYHSQIFSNAIPEGEYFSSTENGSGQYYTMYSGWGTFSTNRNSAYIRPIRIDY